MPSPRCLGDVDDHDVRVDVEPKPRGGNSALIPHHVTWWSRGGPTDMDNLTSCKHAPATYARFDAVTGISLPSVVPDGDPSGPWPAVELGPGRSVRRLEVVERNGDAFIVEGHVSVRRFAATAACDAPFAALHAWRSELAAVYETLAGQARFEQSGLTVVMETDGRGEVKATGVFDSDTGWGDGERAVLRFQLPPLDQTDLPSVIAMLDQAMVMPPREDEDEG